MKVVFPLAKRLRRLLAVALMVVLLLPMLAMTRPAAAAAPEAQVTNGVYHIVQPGEYLAQIAARYGTTVQNLLWANPQITNWNLIYPGQVLFIPFGPVLPPPPPPTPQPPPPPPPQACRWYHVVTPGQTLISISRWYGVDPWAIAQANGILNMNLIYSGSTLCIP